jgi:RNA polymerase sigma factor for flagellar operon FliA
VASIEDLKTEHRLVVNPTEPVSANQRDHEQMVAEHIPLVHIVAGMVRRSLPKHVLLDDLVQAGMVGLLDAATKYDPRREVKFESYAKFRIRGAILDSLREMDWSPRELRRKERLLDEVHCKLCSRLARDPCEPEVAAEFGIELSELQTLKLEVAGLRIESTVVSGANHGESFDLCEYLPAQPDETPLLLCLRSEAKNLLRSAIAELPSQQRTVMVLYYCDHLTMKECGSALGVGESRVSQIHSVALRALRVWFAGRAPDQAWAIG